jgi:hypothetical protein
MRLASTPAVCIDCYNHLRDALRQIHDRESAFDTSNLLRFYVIEESSYGGWSLDSVHDTAVSASRACASRNHNYTPFGAEPYYQYTNKREDLIRLLGEDAANAAIAKAEGEGDAIASDVEIKRLRAKVERLKDLLRDCRDLFHEFVGNNPRRVIADVDKLFQKEKT